MSMNVLQALVMYQMYDRGQIKSLDDPLSKYCPTFSMINTYNSRNITLRQIAAQVSLLIISHIAYSVRHYTILHL